MSVNTIGTGAHLGACNAPEVGENGTDTTGLKAGAEYEPAGDTSIIDDMTGANVLASAGNGLS